MLLGVEEKKKLDHVLLCHQAEAAIATRADRLIIKTAGTMTAHTRTTTPLQHLQNQTCPEDMINENTEDNAMTDVDLAETEKQHAAGDGEEEEDDVDGTDEGYSDEDDVTDESSSTFSSKDEQKCPSSLLAEVEKFTASFPGFSKNYKITGKIGEGNTPTSTPA